LIIRGENPDKTKDTQQLHNKQRPSNIQVQIWKTQICEDKMRGKLTELKAECRSIGDVVLEFQRCQVFQTLTGFVFTTS
jgi:hypothetical protein